MKKRTLLALLMLIACVSIHTTLNAQQISFAPYQNYPLDGDIFTNHLTTGDFNNDTRTDVIVGNAFSSNPTYDYNLFVYLQDVNGNLLPPIMCPYHPIYPGLRAIASGDINSDGRTDVIIGFGDSIGVFLQDMFGSLSPQQDYYVGHVVNAVKVGDANNDGFPDIVVSSLTSYISIFYSDNIGLLSPIPMQYPSTAAGFDDIEIAKLGNDDFNSIIKMKGSTLNPYISIYTIALNKTLNTLIDYTISAPQTSPNSMVTGDIDGDGRNELMYDYQFPATTIAVWKDFSQTLPDTSFPTQQNVGALACDDLNCDGKDDIAMLRYGYSSVYVISDNVGYSFQVPAPNPSYPDAIEIADVNGDGKLDIVSCNSYSGLSVLLNTTDILVTGTSGQIPCNKVKVFPNPFTSEFTIELGDKTADITLIDILGNEIIRAKGNGRIVCKADIPSGTYLLKIQTDNIFFQRTIIKE